MLKHNIAKKAFLVLFGISLLFISCKTVPQIAPVDPIALLDNDAALYVYIPVEQNKDFVNRAFSKLAGISEKDSDMIVSRTQVIAAAVPSNNHNTQISSLGNYPLKYLKYALNEKNGWIAQAQSIGESSYNYYVSQKNAIEVSVLSPSNAVVSSKLEPMIQKFDFASKLVVDQENLNPVPVGFDEEVYKTLLTNQKGEINFYSKNPSLFLQSFIGKKIDVGITKVSGFLLQVEGKESFGVNIKLELLNPQTMKATIAAIKLAMFPITAKITQSSSKTITISDITMKWDKIIELLSK